MACALRILNCAPVRRLRISTRLCKGQDVIPSGLVANFRRTLEEVPPKIGPSNTWASRARARARTHTPLSSAPPHCSSRQRLQRGGKAERICVRCGARCCSPLTAVGGCAGPDPRSMQPHPYPYTHRGAAWPPLTRESGSQERSRLTQPFQSA